MISWLTVFLRACETKEGHFRWFFLSSVTHFEEGRITLILYISKYAMTIYEGILFVTILSRKSPGALRY